MLMEPVFLCFFFYLGRSLDNNAYTHVIKINFLVSKPKQLIIIERILLTTRNIC